MRGHSAKRTRIFGVAGTGGTLPERLAVLGVLAVLAFAPANADQFSDFAKGMARQMSTPSGANLSDADIGAGLKEALAKGTRNAVNQLGRGGGFWNDERFRIPLPGIVEQAQGLLRGAGYGAQVDALHLQMNRAAEQAVPVAADVFGDAVKKLTLQDVRGILGGGQDSATEYFKRATRDTLTAKFRPIVTRVTAKSGLVQQYDAVLSSAGPMASMLGQKMGSGGDVNSYVTGKALDALYLRIADEEKDIRQNPAARSTALLKKVFGS